jgi:hypothetical protein
VNFNKTVVFPNEWNHLKFSELFNILNFTIMAKFDGPFQFDGSMGGMNFYYNKVLKRWIARKNGGASKKQIETSPSLARIRENMSEFGACNELCGLFRKSLLDLDHLNYGYYMGDVVKKFKIVQLMDPEGDRGHRNIEFSQHKSILTDINFNEQHPFNQVVMRHPEVITDDERQTVMVNLPQFYPRKELIWRKPYSFYRFTVTIAQLSDYKWNELHKAYEIVHTGLNNRSVTVYSDWLLVGTNADDISLAASFADNAIPPSDATVMVAQGVEFATMLSNKTISWTKGDGTMKILDCL